MKIKGFGLIEVLVTIAILGIISVVFIQSYLNSQKTFDVQKSKSALQTETRNSLDQIAKWVKLSTSVVSTLTVDNKTYTTSSEIIILKVLSVDDDQDVIADTYDYIVFQPNSIYSNQLDQMIYPDNNSSREQTSRTLDKNLSAIEFKYYNNSDAEITQNFEDTVSVNTAISSVEVIRETTNTVTFSTKAKLRNKN
jgi:prepilin-type N-terminal cleavage/methylation domain-containing protein